MFEKLIATFLLGLMMMVTATSQGRVCYCLCFNTISLGHCGCVEIVEAVQADDGPGEPSGCHCCEEHAEAEAVIPATLSHDCSLEFLFEVDDYCRSLKPAPSVNDEESGNVFLCARPGIMDCLWSCHRSSFEVRGPPDPFCLQDVPLYLRHLVFLV